MEILKIGSSGALVSRLQLGLQRSGNTPGALDGVFGTATDRALRQFQASRGLAADGLAGPKTQWALEPWYTGFFHHRLRPGDTLWRLASRYQTSLRAIETANPNADPLRLQPGDCLIIPLAFSVVPGDIPWSAALAADCVRGLTARYPFLQAQTFGQSVLGRPLHCLSLGSGDRRVLYNAAHHANEWITTPVLFRFAELLAQAWADDALLYGVSARQLLDAVTLSLVPLVNPDGVDLVTGALSDPALLAQTQAMAEYYPAIPYPEGWKANIRGVDLNLQYPARWEMAREIKFEQGFTQPGPRDYVGSAPLTAPESRALARLTRRLSPDLTLSYHTQGEVIYWRFADYLPDGSLELGERLAEASGYTLETTPAASANAGYKDWYIQTYNRPGYTIECGLGQSPLPLAQLPEIFRRNLGILVLAAQG